MTVNNCIAYIDSIEPNAYTAAQKAMWISECEGKVYTDLFLLQPNEFTPVTYDADKDRMLALPAPYDRLYPRYLQAMIHYANGEYDRYANSMAAFNEVWGGLHRWFGANYDVSDRRRNRRVTLSVAAPDPVNDTDLTTVPQGCALVGGRFIVRKAATMEWTTYYTENNLGEGVYNFMVGVTSWMHFTVAQGTTIPAGSRIDCDSQRRLFITPPGGSATQYTATGGRDSSGTDLDLNSPMRITFDGDVVAEARPDVRGSYPVPMLIADREGSMLGVGRSDLTAWSDDPELIGEILFTARLLVPDEEFPFN